VQDDGHAEAQFHAGTHWGNALVPALDVSQTASGKLTAERLRAALLLPFVANVFAELDGRIDANASFTADPATGVAHPEGSAQLSNGSFELISLGGEFADVSGKVVMTPDGLARLEDFVAHGLTGRLEAAATARLEGLRFGGLTATLQIPKKEAIPAVFDGVQYGAVDGKVEIGVEPVNGGGLDVKMDAQALHVDLPTTGQHNVQPLGPLDKVVTGAYLAGQDFVEIPLDGTVSTAVTARAPITIRIHLGDDVRVVRGSELDVRLGGDPVIRIAQDVTVTGQIILLKGTIEVSGKQFTIEKGTITFDGQDPSNPLVVLTAEWTASDQTRIFADFNGPLKSDKSLKLRSDPMLSEAEILQLILTNQTQEQAAASNQPTQSTLGTGAGVAAMPINQALGGLNRIGKLGGETSISAKVDTSNTNPMPEAQLQIARDISIRVGYIIGTPTFGSSDTVLVTLSWAFARRWNLETTAGNSGTTVLDLIWQHRY
jgi:translocation and assembly module TamB